jgi:hypothetical protein
MNDYGVYYNFSVFLAIPYSQRNVSKPTNVPGAGATWGEWANNRPLIVKRKTNNLIIVPLRSGQDSWFQSRQIQKILDANGSLTLYTDVQFQSQCGTDDYYEVDSVTEDISLRSDYYEYTGNE